MTCHRPCHHAAGRSSCSCWGLTVSASIPVAVISITLFMLLSKVGLRDATILEHNIVQTAGSAGESIAFGLGVTMPAITGFGIGLAYKTLTEAQLTAEGDKSPGVLLASGYIAGGAIAGIVIAFMAGIMGDFTERITAWSTLHNPFFAGPRADFLSMIPFILLVVLLYLVGREAILRPRHLR